VTGVHRPLCEWTTEVPAGPDGVAVWDPWAAPNGGDRWSDARQLPLFDDEWRRVLVRVRTPAGEHSVLGLARGKRVVLELDGTAAPIPISDEALTLIDRFERAWPDVRALEGDREVLADEPPVIRHALLSRLSVESSSVRPDLFHLLPWDSVTAIAEELTVALGEPAAGRAGAPSRHRLRHWFTPTGSRFSAALDQLNAGVADGSPALIREAGTALCARLLEADLERFPRPSRAALAALVRRIAERDPLLADTAARAAGRLEGGRPDGVPDLVVPSDLELAASEADQRERHSDVRVGPLTLVTDVTQGGMIFITAAFDLTPEETGAVREGYGVVIVTVRVTDEDDTTRRVLIPMVPQEPSLELSGGVGLAAPGGMMAVVPEGPPVGSVESWHLDANDVAYSYGVADQVTKDAWQALAAGSPAGHPVVEALRNLGVLGEDG
jgi:hypothetical protein